MVTTAGSVEWTVVGTEVEALQLEYNWIKEFDPRFNVRYRDDKSYPWLAVTLYEEYPRLQVMRGAKRKGVRYFGPYAHAWAIRETLDLLLRVFPARTCRPACSSGPARSAGPACSATSASAARPASARVSAEEHREIVDDFCDFMAGQTDLLMRRLEREMRQASDDLEFERAARLRDDLEALRRAMEKQAVVFGDGTDADVVAFAQDDLEAAVQVFHVRGGRVRGQRGWVVDKVEPVEDARAGRAVPGAVLRRRRRRRAGRGIPREILVPELPDDVERCREWLSERRGQPGQHPGAAARRQAVAAGDGRPQRRAGLRPAQAQAGVRPDRPLAGAGGAAGGPRAGRCAAAHRVLRHQPRAGHQRRRQHGGVRGRLARKSEYRRFAMRGRRRRHRLDRRGGRPPLRPLPRRAGRPTAPTPGSPTTRRRPPAAIRRRRAPASTRPPAGPASSPTRRTCSSSTAARRRSRRPGPCSTSSASTTSPWSGWPSDSRRSGCPGEAYPVILPRTSEALYLLQRVRDEAHRFAITYHRQKRSKAMTTSVARRRRRAGGDPAQGAAQAVRLAQAAAGGERRGDRAVPGHRPAHRRGDRRRACATPSAIAAPAVNVTTGEVLDGSLTPSTAADDATSEDATLDRRLNAARSRRWSSPGCPAPAAAPRPSAWRISATTSSTTCRRSCSARWSTSAAAPRARSPASPS